MFTPADFDVNTEFIFMIEWTLTYRWWAWLVSSCQVKQWIVNIVSIKTMSDITVILHVALSTHICLFSWVVLHDYAKLLRKIKL